MFFGEKKGKHGPPREPHIQKTVKYQGMFFRGTGLMRMAWGAEARDVVE